MYRGVNNQRLRVVAECALPGKVSRWVSIWCFNNNHSTLAKVTIALRMDEAMLGEFVVNFNGVFVEDRLHSNGWATTW